MAAGCRFATTRGTGTKNWTETSGNGRERKGRNSAERDGMERDGTGQNTGGPEPDEMRMGRKRRQKDGARQNGTRQNGTGQRGRDGIDGTERANKAAGPVAGGKPAATVHSQRKDATCTYG